MFKTNIRQIIFLTKRLVFKLKFNCRQIIILISRILIYIRFIYYISNLYIYILTEFRYYVYINTERRSFISACLESGDIEFEVQLIDRYFMHACVIL